MELFKSLKDKTKSYDTPFKHFELNEPLTDEAIASYKNIPHLDYKRRKIIIQNIKYVKKVIPQKTLDYVSNLNLVKPDFVVHGDDWKNGVQKKTRDRVIKTLKKWSGKLIEPKY